MTHADIVVARVKVYAQLVADGKHDRVEAYALVEQATEELLDKGYIAPCTEHEECMVILKGG